ncbi:hypothetical protein SAMN02910377_00188 [Pseudobutyrivibrio ruminis]|uniref:Uncharacterized protein n=1 Tax=Pseudobutyrivibrio ruminis TaxID=46206 RepID=A0A1H7EXH7_9FIRM|nr:hypothetical protein [Pseudobutyrivibrio ruminis]SEK18586.1 hypothetical protein SAMN02910377_00188 [Pseudobutyrivibrio ruminis]
MHKENKAINWKDYIADMKFEDMGDGDTISLTYCAVPICAIAIDNNIIAFRNYSNASCYSELLRIDAFIQAIVKKIYDYGVSINCNHIDLNYMQVYYLRHGDIAEWQALIENVEQSM